MQLIDGRGIYSASDLVGFLACEHLTNLELAATGGLVKRPFREDPELDLIARRGVEHEQRFLAELRTQGRRVTEIKRDGSGTHDGAALREAAEEVITALRRGDDVVYQATLFDGQWRGHADFLVRVDAPSSLGPWSYEVYDTKLARQTTAGALLQLCLYTDLLTAVQGFRPERMHVALGGSTRHVEGHRVADYETYYRLVKRRFEEFVSVGQPTFPPPTRPDPVEHCEVCRWAVDCQKERRRKDDLSLIAGITGRQRRSLRKHGVTTRRGVAELPLPISQPIEGTQADALVRVREQARIQVEGELEGKTLYELLDPKLTSEAALEPNLGLLSLPEPSSGDLFFDIEGDPFAFEDGIDYLFGILEPGLPGADGQPTFHRYWSKDESGAIGLAGEKRTFEKVVDFFMDRLARDPHLHIYHYAPYEPSAMGRLMGRYASREDEVDQLLRGKVFVDLYRVVRQSLRASVESYSIKRLEPLYGFERTVDLRDAGSSLVALSTWLDMGGQQGGDHLLLGRVEDYNRDDCSSNWRLRDWLEVRRSELAERIGVPIPRPIPADAKPSEALSDHLARVKAVEEKLTAGVPIDPAQRSDEQKATWLLAHLLSWHRREEKAGWWRWYFLRDDLTDEERIEEPEPIGGLSYERVIGEVAKSRVYRYRFPAQEHDVSSGRRVIDPATKKSPGTVECVDNAAGTIDLKRGLRSDSPNPKSVVPELVVTSQEQKESLLRIGEWVSEHGLEGPGPYRAARELLLRRPPRLAQEAGTPLAGTEPGRQTARRLVLALDGSCLAIQGPPGSGKTTTGAEMIVDLVTAGKRIGVTANSHKVIGHFLDEVAAVATKRGQLTRIGQKPGSGDAGTCRFAECFSTNEGILAALQHHQIDVAGGTTWMWSRAEFMGVVDVLFVDEAGQMALANVIAAAGCGSSLVLLGDPQQLNQPLRGSQPPGAEKSGLAHLLGEDATMPPALGLFFEGTWRLHPHLCEFTSSAFYDGRLLPEAKCELQRVSGTGALDGTGIRFLPVVHVGNSKASTEEAEEVARRVQDLIEAGGRWFDSKGTPRPIGLDDILVITPYNAQVQAIAEALPGVRVGTVDKFQGQEAPISIYSMATSSPEEAPRGMEFLYSLNRLNVATSRARCLAVVIASPELIRVRCRTPRQMRLANALCRLIELGAWPETGCEAPARVSD